MTVSTIFAEKGREVVTIEPGASLADAAKLLAERRIGAVLILGADRRWSVSSPSVTSCARSPNAAPLRSMSRSVRR